jgi:hypothetical protein
MEEAERKDFRKPDEVREFPWSATSRPSWSTSRE